VLAGKGRVLFIECKGRQGYPSAEQRRWLVELGAGGAETFVWRPQDLENGTADRVLRRSHLVTETA